MDLAIPFRGPMDFGDPIWRSYGFRRSHLEVLWISVIPFGGPMDFGDPI